MWGMYKVRVELLSGAEVFQFEEIATATILIARAGKDMRPAVETNKEDIYLNYSFYWLFTDWPRASN